MHGTPAWTPAVQQRNPAVQFQVLPRLGSMCPISVGTLSEHSKGKAAAAFGDEWSLLVITFCFPVSETPLTL